MIVSTDRQFIYTRVPKTASTSVAAALEPYRRREDRGLLGRIGRRVVPSWHHPLLVDFRAHSHWGLQAAREILPAASFGRFFKFSVVRHPFERTVSVYNHILRNEQTAGFEEVFGYVYRDRLDLEGFVATFRERPIPPQAMLLIDYAGNVLADAVVRVERLQAEICSIFNQIGISEVIPVLNQGQYRRDQALSSHAKELIRNRYEVDFQLFGYESDSVIGKSAPLEADRLETLGRILARHGAIDFSPWNPLQDEF